MSANDKQVGGEHYRAEVQHWDWIEENGIGYLEGCATKYGTRSRKKHEAPTEDWQKAEHYVQKMIDLYRAGIKNPRGGRRTPLRRFWYGLLARLSIVRKKPWDLTISVAKFAAANELTRVETEFCRILATWEDDSDLLRAWSIARTQAKL